MTGEREVAALFEAKGWHVRGLEGGGDHFVVLRTSNGFVPGDPGAAPFIDRRLHLECKRQERLRLPEWLAQADSEAPPGVPAVVCYRQNRAEWYAALKLAALLELIS